MTATIETLHKDGNEIYPTTVADAVVDEDNHTVQQRIDTGVYFLDGGTASVLQPWIVNDMIINGTITPAKLDRAYLPLAGGTMTGRLLSTVTGDNVDNSAIGVRTTGGAAFATFSRTDSDAALGIGVGSGGQNYGVHDRKHNSWMIYNDGTNTHLANNAVETSAIKDKAVTSDKINYSSLPIKTAKISVGSDGKTITFPGGVDLISEFVNYNDLATLRITGYITFTAGGDGYGKAIKIHNSTYLRNSVMRDWGGTIAHADWNMTGKIYLGDGSNDATAPIQFDLIINKQGTNHPKYLQWKCISSGTGTPLRNNVIIGNSWADASSTWTFENDAGGTVENVNALVTLTKATV